MNNTIQFTIKQVLKSETINTGTDFERNVTKCVAEITASPVKYLHFKDFTILCEFDPNSTKNRNYWFDRDSYITQLNNFNLVTSITNSTNPITNIDHIEHINHIKNIIKTAFIEEYDKSLLTIDYDPDFEEDTLIALKDVLYNRALHIVVDVDIAISEIGDMETIWYEQEANIDFTFNKSLEFTGYLENFSNISWFPDSSFLNFIGVYLEHWYSGSYPLTDQQKLDIANDYICSEAEYDIYTNLISFFSEELTAFFMDSMVFNLRAS